MAFKFWLCPKCASPMERPVKGQATYICCFCAHTLDGAYPPPGAVEVSSNTNQYEHDGFRVRKAPNYLIFVTDTRNRPRKLPSHASTVALNVTLGGQS